MLGPKNDLHRTFVAAQWEAKEEFWRTAQELEDEGDNDASMAVQRPDGWQSVDFPSGRHYEGDVVSGKLHGQGTLSHAVTGEVYQGAFCEGKRHGRGVQKCGDASRTDSAAGRRGCVTYEGEWWQGQRHGHGCLTLENGDVYEGSFEHDRISGSGKYRHADGRVYVGEFNDGVKHGRGTLTQLSGDAYTGAFVRGRMTGEGTARYATGRTFAGVWLDGKKVHGTMTFPDGKSYVGAFQSDKPHGQGELKKADGDVYSGAFVAGQFCGQGVMQYGPGKKTVRYFGGWRDGLYHGKGTVALANGRTVEANWSGGKMVGAAVGSGNDGPSGSNPSSPAVPASVDLSSSGVAATAAAPAAGSDWSPSASGPADSPPLTDSPPPSPPPPLRGGSDERASPVGAAVATTEGGLLAAPPAAGAARPTRARLGLAPNDDDQKRGGGSATHSTTIVRNEVMAEDDRHPSASDDLPPAVVAPAATATPGSAMPSPATSPRTVAAAATPLSTSTGGGSGRGAPLDQQQIPCTSNRIGDDACDYSKGVMVQSPRGPRSAAPAALALGKHELDGVFDSDDDDNNNDGGCGGVSSPSFLGRSGSGGGSAPSYTSGLSGAEQARLLSVQFGWLEKFALGRSLFGLGNWKKRFCVLDSEGVFRYFSNSEARSPKHEIWVSRPNVRMVTNPTARCHKEAHCGGRDFLVIFHEASCERRLLLRASCPEDHAKWVVALSKLIAVVNHPRDLNPAAPATDGV